MFLYKEVVFLPHTRKACIGNVSLRVKGVWLWARCRISGHHHLGVVGYVEEAKGGDGFCNLTAIFTLISITIRKIGSGKVDKTYFFKALSDSSDSGLFTSISATLWKKPNIISSVFAYDHAIGGEVEYHYSCTCIITFQSANAPIEYQSYRKDEREDRRERTG